MAPSVEDVQWLRIIDLNVHDEVPPYNQSRLLAMDLIDRSGKVVILTERGKKLLAANPRAA